MGVESVGDVVTDRSSSETFAIERTIRAPRELVWEALLSLLSSAGYATEGNPPPHGAGATIAFRIGDYDLVEETLSLEPPWRRRYTLVAGAPLASYHAAIMLRDDGPNCFLEWRYVADSGGHAGASEFLERAQQALQTATEYIAAEAQGRASNPN